MLRPALFAVALLAAATPIALTFAAANETARPSDSSQGLPYNDVVFGHELLPGPTGWFAVPITTDRDAWVRVDVDASMFQDGSRVLSLAQGIIAVENGESYPWFQMGSSSIDPPVHVQHRGGTLFACCDALGGWSTSEMEGDALVFLTPGQRLWVGLAAYQWELDSHFQVRVSAQSYLTAGEARTGTTVEAVDLAAEALAAGTHVRALGYTLQPETGVAERTWTAERYGIFSVYGFAWNDETTGTLSLAVPGLATVSHAVTPEGVYAHAHRAGTYSVKLEGLEAPLLSQQDGVDAVAFFADVDVPGDVAFIYP